METNDYNLIKGNPGILRQYAARAGRGLGGLAIIASTFLGGYYLIRGAEQFATSRRFNEARVVYLAELQKAPTRSILINGNSVCETLASLEGAIETELSHSRAYPTFPLPGNTEIKNNLRSSYEGRMTIEPVPDKKGMMAVSFPDLNGDGAIGFKSDD